MLVDGGSVNSALPSIVTMEHAPNLLKQAPDPISSSITIP